jgi:hypothetical protein
MRSNRRSAGVLNRAWWLCLPAIVAATAAEEVARVDAPTAIVVDLASDANDPDSLADTEPSIAINPMNPDEIAVVSFSDPWDANDASVMAPVWKSRDGGKTWKKVPQIPRPEAGRSGPGDQKVIFDANGKLYVAELGIGNPIKDYVYRQKAGPDDPLAPGAAFGNDQPHIEVDPSRPSGDFAKKVYSPFLDVPASPNARSSDNLSDDGGATGSDLGVGDNATFPNRTTRIAVSPKSKSAYIVYKMREGAVDSDFEKVHFRVKRSDDLGATWDALGTAGVSVHGNDQAVTFFTENFGNPGKGKVARCRSSDGWIAVGPSSGNGNDPDAVYVAHVNKDSSGFGQIFVARSGDQGATWSSSRVTDGTHHSAYPEIAVAGTGAVGVLYIDYDDSGAKNVFRHHFARSFDGGTNWTDQIVQAFDPGPLDNATSGFLWGDYNGLTAQGDSFYGVFTGQSINRSTPEFDPIFFKESAKKN